MNDLKTNLVIAQTLLRMALEYIGQEIEDDYSAELYETIEDFLKKLEEP